MLSPMNATITKETLSRAVYVVVNFKGQQRGICQTPSAAVALASRDKMDKLAPEQGPFRVEKRWTLKQEWAEVITR